MHQIEVTYANNLHTHCKHIQSGEMINTDAPLENHGKGQYFSPTDLVATALGSCLLTIMGITANTHNITINGTKAKITKLMIKNPRRIGKIIINIIIPQKLTQKEQKLISRAIKACPVHHSLHPEINISINFSFNNV